MTPHRATLCIGLAAALFVGGATVLRAEWRFDPDTEKWTRTAAKDLDGKVSDNQFQQALAAYQQGHADKAERIIKGWLRFYRHKRDSQAALFLLGEARRALGHYDDAYEAYEQLLDGYAGTDLFDRALAHETEMAEGYLNGKKRKILKTLWVTAYGEGETMLEKIFQRDPRGAHGKKASSMLADYHFRQGRFEEAQDEYQRLASNFAGDPEAAKFKLLAAQAALARFRGTRHDARALDEAELQFRQVQDNHPRQARQEAVGQILHGIEDRRAEKDFEIASFYQRVDQPKAAIYYYRAIVRDYAETVWAARAQEQLAALGAERGERAGAAPRVLSSGVGVSPAALAGFPTTAPDHYSGVVIQPSRGPARAARGAEGRPARRPRSVEVLWAGPAPVVRNPDQPGVIDIGLPIDENAARLSIRQFGEMGEPMRGAPTSQPESNHGG